MCGICGFYGKQNKKLLEEMTGALLHRGPDDYGFYEDSLVSLGHRRLSIIDLSQRGRQPMQNEDGSIQLVFNGEIYNFRELRKELVAKGHIFASNTDSEVVIHAYEQWGQGCVERFNGMFAFALWDTKNKKLLLVRDRIGIKPLYYARTKNRFIFASELKALIKDKDIDRGLNSEKVNIFMAFQCIRDDSTVFNDVNKLKPGHMLIFQNEKVEIERYWQLKKNPQYNSKEYVNKLKELLVDSVRLRLVSDVPLGVLLSGGLDSSILTALASKLSSDKIQTFSVGFGETSDEFAYAKIVAEKFDTKHNEVVVTPYSLRGLLDKITYSLDEPLADGGAFATYLAAEALKSQVKVLLVGEGSDELFGGYSWHSLACFPLSLLPYQVKKKVYFYLTTFYQGNDRKVFNDFSNIFDHLFESDLKANFFSKMSAFETKYILPNSLLMKVDKMTMAHSIEARVPFLDHRIVEVAYNLSLGLSPINIVSKKIPKALFKEMLPRAILKRKKHGFILPVQKWLFGDLKSYAQDVLLNSRSVFAQEITKKEIERLFYRPRNPLIAIENTSRLWRLLIFQLWSNNFVKSS